MTSTTNTVRIIARYEQAPSPQDIAQLWDACDGGKLTIDGHTIQIECDPGAEHAAPVAERLLAAIPHGPPHLHVMWQTGEPFFQADDAPF